VSSLDAQVLSADELIGAISAARERDGFTLLSLLTAVDTGEALEMVYVLVRPSDRARTAFKVPVAYGSPSVPTLSGMWAGADWLEREVYDLFGIRFEGHPYLRRLFLDDDFDGHPLLKSYTRLGAPYESTSVHTTESELAEHSPGEAFLERLNAHDTLHTEKLVLNMGPQHPSTHGVLHILLAMQGEVILAAEPSIGYLHRCIEKLAESRTYKQCISLMDRADYVSGFHTELAFCMAAEQLAEIEVPPKAHYIRVIMTELNRISSHLVWLAAYGLDMGAFTPLLYCFREREDIMEYLEAVSGGRMMFNYFRPGGVKDDLPPGLDKKLAAYLRTIDAGFDEYEQLLTGNEIFLARTKGVGIQTAELLDDYCVTGPVRRSVGDPRDLRIDEPYAAYADLGVRVPVGTVGDCFDKYAVRIAEMRESARLALAALEALPEGNFVADMPRVFRPPAGEAYAMVESPRGDLGVYLVSDGGPKPARCKLRSPAFSNLSVLPAALAGQRLPDAIAIAGMVDVVMGEIDR
jgi:NADH:ubiquinone oxidoreductase subunit D/NADH:ubiquinone oxidoreductase subunit C